MIAVPPFFAEYQALVNAELGRLVAGRWRRGLAVDGLHGARAVQARAAGADAARRGALRRIAAARAFPPPPSMELVHASSLILDDLPSMDDAPLRRGRKSNHLEFGEAIAILAAFGLLNLAYGTLARAYEAPLAARLCVARRGGRRPRRLDWRSGGRSPRDRAADQLRDARTDPSREDRRALQRGRDLRRDDRRRRRRTRSRRSRRTRRTSVWRFRSSMTCWTSKAIRRKRARRCARTPRRPPSSRSAAWLAHASSRRSCARPPIGRSRPSAGARIGCGRCRRSWRAEAGNV